jgi:hypothetical protein
MSAAQGFDKATQQMTFKSVVAQTQSDPNLCRVELQLFEDGPEYLFRVIEGAPVFREKHAELASLGITPEFYDSRDEKYNDPGNKVTADWMDAEIDKGRFFMYPVLGAPDFNESINEWGKNLFSAELTKLTSGLPPALQQLLGGMLGIEPPEADEDKPSWL